MKTFPSTLVRASAGSGKTTQLSDRYIELLLAGVNPEKILSTTFTKKAAGEIFTRIFNRLATAYLLPEKVTSTWVKEHSKEKIEKALNALIASQHRVQITTMDSFFISILKAFSLDFGILPGWEPTEDPKVAFSDALSKVLREVDSGVMAGLLQFLGSGKFKRSVVNLISYEFSNLYDLYQETNDNAWNWLKVKKPFDEEKLIEFSKFLDDFEIPLTKTGKTPNSLWKKAIDKLKLSISSEDWTAVLSNGLIKKVLAKEEKFSSFEIPSDLQEILKNILDYTRYILLGKISKSNLAASTILNLIAIELNKIKNESGKLSFTDIKTILKEKLSDNLSEEIYYRLDSKISHLLLDEFQDTSRTEWSIISKIVDEIMSKSSPNSEDLNESSFFCVGDEKQSIYEWRGGVPELISSLEKRYQNLSVLPISSTYRCSAVVLSLVNKIFTNLKNNPALSKFPEVSEYWSNIFDEHTNALGINFGDTEVIEFSESDDVDQEKQVAEFVNEFLSKNPNLSIAILTRSNLGVQKHVAALSKLGIKVSEEGGVTLDNFKEVKLFISLLEYVDNPDNSLAMFHVLNSILMAEVKKLDVDMMKRKIYKKGYGAFLDDLALKMKLRTNPIIKKLIQHAFIFDQDFKGKTSEFIEYIKTRKIINQKDSRVRVMTIHASKGLGFDCVILPELDGKLTFQRAPLYLVDRKSPESAPHKVSRMTKEAIREFSPELQKMHRAAVVAKVKESLCTLYVAMTRAKSHLYMFVPKVKEGKKAGATYAGILQEI